MYIGGKHFHADILNQIRETIRDEPTISRRKLSRHVCDWLDWRSPNGRPKDMSCRKALVELNRRGLLDLPKQERTHSFNRPAGRPMIVETADISCSLPELGEITVEMVTSRYSKASKIWFSFMNQHHYLGGAPSCGAQIRYLVRSSVHSYIGALAFRSASWVLGKRDKYIGWTESARRANLERVITNDRFLISPSVHVKNLASHILSLTLSRLSDDWEHRYHVRPVLIETFVDPSRFNGTSYQAANWTEIGLTTGRQDGVCKKIFVYPLDAKWREILRVEPPVRLGENPRSEAPAHWAEEEFSTVRLYDDRLKQRLYTVAQDFYGRPQANIPEACGSKPRTMGAYRFFQNKKVTMDVVLTAHTEATIERIKEHRIVLAPQDTTTLSYSTHPMTEDLGPVNNVDNKAVGLILHDTLAFTEEGTPLGVLDAQCWARNPEDKGRSNRRKEEPIEKKESIKWLRSFRKVTEIQKLCPDTMLISMGDRESDIYELFLEATKDPHGPKLLVRAEKTRQRQVEQEALWDFMGRQDVAGSLKIHIPRSGPRKARDAWINIRFSKVNLTPPKESSYPSVEVWAVHVLEQDAEEIDPIEWMLFTTVEVKNFEDAKKRVEWYAGRWGIEVYHRTLKSGCRIKDRQLGTADRLETCLGIDMVVAWRIFHLTMLGRETPNVPCTVFFKDVEWKALCCYVSKKPTPPQEPPTLQKAIRMVGAIGGHLGRRRDGPPGTQTLWRGLQRLDTATEMYGIVTHQDYSSPYKSGP